MKCRNPTGDTRTSESIPRKKVQKKQPEKSQVSLVQFLRLETQLPPTRSSPPWEEYLRDPQGQSQSAGLGFLREGLTSSPTKAQ